MIDSDNFHKSLQMIADMEKVRSILDRYNVQSENLIYADILEKIIKELENQRIFNTTNTIFINKVKKLLEDAVIAEDPSDKDYISTLELIKRVNHMYIESLSKIKQIVNNII